jgi:hypothetical protein
MDGMVSWLGGPNFTLLALGDTTRFLTIFFIFLTPPFLTADDEDAVPLTGSRFVDVDAAAAAAPPLVVKS